MTKNKDKTKAKKEDYNFEDYNFTGHRIKLYPTEEQKILFRRYAGARRFVYNWALNEQKLNYDQGNKFINKNDMCKELTKLKKVQGYEWLKEINTHTLRGGIFGVDTAYKSFFSGETNHPKFKRKKREGNIYSFETREDKLHIYKGYVYLSGIHEVKCGKHRINLKKENHYCSAYVSFDGVDYWLSLNVKEQRVVKNNPNLTQEVIGIDLGIKTLAYCSNGITYHRVNTSRKEVKLKRLQRKAGKIYNKMLEESKRTKTKFSEIKKSKNLLKLERKIAKVRVKITNMRKTHIHQMTTAIVKRNPKCIVIEDLSVTDLLKNAKGRKHRKLIVESQFYEIQRQLKYKTAWNGINIITADKHYASSKLCSKCGNKKSKLSLNERIYRCDVCGIELDRDYNASKNLEALGY